MATLVSTPSRNHASPAKSANWPQITSNQWAEAILAAATLIAIMGTVFFLAGFVLWSEVIVFYRAFQSSIGPQM